MAEIYPTCRYFDRRNAAHKKEATERLHGSKADPQALLTLLNKIKKTYTTGLSMKTPRCLIDIIRMQ